MDFIAKMAQGSGIKDGEGNVIGRLVNVNIVNSIIPHNLKQQVYNSLKMVTNVIFVLK